MMLSATASLLMALLMLVANIEASESPKTPRGKVDDVLEASQVPTSSETEKSSSEEEVGDSDEGESCIVPDEDGLTAENLDEFAEKLEARKILIHYEVAKVKGDNGKKHVLLHYYDVYGQGRQLKTYCLAEMFPLDISAFIGRGLANEDDELDVEFRDQEVIARIRHPTTSSSADGDKDHKEYTLLIRTAGGIGYVRLGEIEEAKALPNVRYEILGAKGQEKDHEEEEAEERLYYVRVPFNLFTKLDGEALEKAVGAPFRFYKKYLCKSSVPPASASESSFFQCLVLTFGTGDTEDDEQCIQTELATQLYFSEIPPMHFITAKEVGHFDSSNPTWRRRPFVADPELAGASNVQYVVLAGLTEFNRMELKFVEKHGRLVKQEPVISRGMLQLKFEKDRKTTIIPFLFMSCWIDRCLNADQIGSTAGNHSEAEPEEAMGVTYTYGGKWGMP